MLRGAGSMFGVRSDSCPGDRVYGPWARGFRSMIYDRVRSMVQGDQVWGGMRSMIQGDQVWDEVRPMSQRIRSMVRGGRS